MFRQITIQLTNRCNMHCPYCFAEKNVQDIDDAHFSIFYEFCKRNNIESIHVTGGEPLLHENAAEYIMKLSQISDLVVYSNFTVPDVVSKIRRELHEIHYLVNVNERGLYKKDQLDYFHQNMRAAILNGARITLSKTFYKKPFLLEDIFTLGEKYDIHRLRMSHATSDSICNNSYLLCDDIKLLYRYVYEHMEEIRKRGITRFYFDCPVKQCQIDQDIYHHFLEWNMIGRVCLPKIVVSMDLRIFHCYVEKENYECYLHEFDSFEKAYCTINKRMRSDAVKAERNTNCNQCINFKPYVLCGCPYEKQ